MRGKRIVIVPGTHFVRTGEGLRSPNDTFFRFAANFFEHFDEVTLCSPIVDSHRPGTPLGYRVSDGFDFVKIPAYWTWTGYARHLPGIALASYTGCRRAFRGADLVWLRLPSPNAPVAYRAARDEGRPVVLYIASDIRRVVEERNAESPWMRRAQSPFWYLMDRMTGRMIRKSVTFALGEELFQHAIRIGGAAAHVHRAFPSTTSRSELYEREAVPPDCRLLFVGRLSPEKQVPVLIEAVGELLAEGCEVTLDVVGESSDPSETERIRRRVASLGDRASAVTMHGQIINPRQLDLLYRRAAALVLPSLTEGLPKVIIEAMARSVPVIASSVGGIPELVTHGVNGLLVSARDRPGLVEALRRFSADAEFRRRLGVNAYATAVGRTGEAEVERLLRIVNDVYAHDGYGSPRRPS